MSEGYSQGGEGVRASPSGFLNDGPAAGGAGQKLLEACKKVAARRESLVRLLTLLLSIIVFGTISDGGWTVNGQCVFYARTSTCGFGFTTGLVAFFASIGFLTADVLIIYSDLEHYRRPFDVLDMAFSGLWTFMWFVSFCVLADHWRRSPRIIFTTMQRNSAQSAIAFSFFSIFAWGYLSFLSTRVSARQPGYNDFDSEVTPASHAPNSTPYQEAPGADGDAEQDLVQKTPVVY
eukprot:scpid94017/ scgid11721/ Synaptogyrin-3